MNNKLKEIITSRHLDKLLTCQKYFVWHELANSKDNENDDYHNLEFDLPSFIDEFEHSLSEIQSKSISIIKTSFLKKMQQQFLELEIVPQKDMQERAIITSQMMQNNRIIYNPTFIFKYQSHDLIANPIVYDPQTKSVSFLKMSTNTKRRDIIKMFFDINVMKMLQIEVKNVYLYIIATKKYLKGEVDFFPTTFINNQKSGPHFKDKNTDNYYENAQLLKAGISNENSWNILKMINSEQNNLSFRFDNFENYLQQIIHARDYHEIMPLCEEDNQFMGDCNISWKTIVKLKNDQWYHGYNGKIVTKLDIIKQIPLPQLAHEKMLLQMIIKNPQKILVNKAKVLKIIKDINNARAIWFDFEAFSLPIAPLNNFLPFSQVVSQVSIIKTNKMVEDHAINIVIDPQTINYDDFANIINAIYDSQAQYYIVYNATYEHSRLNDFITKMRETNYATTDFLSLKVDEIIKKTIDLATLFSTSSSKHVPPILITDLKGLYSIKKLEQFITQFYPNFFYKIKKYENLAISNGLYAMQITNNRALNIIGDNEWKQKVLQLGEYCENDVRAMIMVYHFVKELLNH